MQVMYKRCCGLDIHKKSIVACRVIPGPEGEWRREACTFGTTTRDLLQLAAWLKEEKVTHVALESTGIYWKPVYNLLEGQFEVLVVNAQRRTPAAWAAAIDQAPSLPGAGAHPGGATVSFFEIRNLRLGSGRNPVGRDRNSCISR
jgi:hypothetical protein